MHAPEHDPEFDGPDFETGEALRYRRPAGESAQDSWPDSWPDEVPDRPPAAAADRPGAGAGAGRSRLAALVRGPRARPLLIAAGVLLLLLALGITWYVDPTNRARRELAQANQRILDKQREVDDARRLLERRIAELRAVRAEADVYATVYRGVLEREGKRGEKPTAPLDATANAPAGAPSGGAAAGGEVALPPVAPRP
jgi:hypothetical protein